LHFRFKHHLVASVRAPVVVDRQNRQAGPQGEGGQGLVGAGDFPEEGHVDAFIPVRILVDQEGNRLALAQQAQDVHCRVALGNGPVAAP